MQIKRERKISREHFLRNNSKPRLFFLFTGSLCKHTLTSRDIVIFLFIKKNSFIVIRAEKQASDRGSLDFELDSHSRGN